MAMNCSNTRRRISFCERQGEPPRIMLVSPSNSTSATAPSAIGTMTYANTSLMTASYHPAGTVAIAPTPRQGSDAVGEAAMNDDPGPNLQPRTLAAQALGGIEPATKAVVPPVHVATTYIRDPDNQYRAGFIYGRPDNATVRQCEAVIAVLEGAADAKLFGAGMAAAIAVVLALDPPAHIIAPTVMYWGLRRWFVDEAPRYGYRVTLVDTTELDALRAATRPGATQLVWIESPANPLWTVTDVAAAAEIAHGAGAILAIDSTVATPILTRPLALGADIVMHSATKYLNGHSDVIAGALATARSDPLWTRIETVRTGHGAILGPFEAWLLLRCLRTLDVRVRAQSQAALELARRLEQHRDVDSVLYPGLPDHPGHAVAARQMTGGFGGMLSIRVKR